MLTSFKFGEKIIYLKNNIIELFQANKESLFTSEIDYFEKAIKSNNISFNKYSKSIFIGNKSGNLAIIELPKSNNKK